LIKRAGQPDAKEVFVTGTFDDWTQSVKLEKKGDIFEKTVELPADKKVLYKVRAVIVHFNKESGPEHEAGCSKAATPGMTQLNVLGRLNITLCQTLNS
jgi:hypothetical protein